MTETDIGVEAERINAAARANSTDIRFIGGLAIARHCPSAREHPVFKREYADIDIVASPGQRKKVIDLFEALGYEQDKTFNDLHGHSRLLFYAADRDRQVDVFLGQFRMCHTLDLRDRLLDDYDSLPLADLLLTKLQIVELNEKDAKDAIVLLLDHDVAESEDPSKIDMGYIRSICSADWGLFTTFTDNLKQIRGISRDILDESEHAVVAGRIDRICSELEASQKTLKWRMRSRVGRRVVWYELPEEVSDSLTVRNSVDSTN